MRWLDEQAIGYAISADMSPQLSQCIAALPEDHWTLDREETDAIREWAEVNYLPSDGIWKKDAVSPRRSGEGGNLCLRRSTSAGASRFKRCRQSGVPVRRPAEAVAQEIDKGPDLCG
jgi:hypothetical protein